MGITKGTWFRLPDFGITEKLFPNSGSSLLSNPNRAPVIGPQPSTGIQSGMTTQQANNALSSNPSPLAPKPMGQTSGASPSNYSQPQQQQPQQDPFAGQGEAAKSQAQIELEQVLGEYDRYAEEAQAQSANLDTQKASAMGSMENTLSRSKAEATAAKGEAVSATASAKNKALSTAQDVQRSNRNVLRALGILSSSAAGEMLNKPMNEFGSQAADLEQGLVKRLGVVEDWMLGKQSEFQQAKTDLEQKFTELKGNIDRDLRFNDRQRVTAVKAAGAALQQRLADIQVQSANYQTAAKQYSDNMLLQLAQMKMYQNPSADVSSIYNTLLSSANQGRQPQQVGIQQSAEDLRKKQQTLSGY